MIPRCTQPLEVFIEPNWPDGANGEIITPGTQLIRCLLLNDHLGPHRSMVGEKAVVWPRKEQP